MQMIYVDEAGTSPKEPVRVVCSVIINADQQLQNATDRLADLIDKYVPSDIREGFVCHATDIFSGGPYRKIWSRESRQSFLYEILSIPRDLKLPIAIGVVHRGAYDSLMKRIEVNELKKKKIDSTTIEHCVAFATCLSSSDLFLRKYLDGKEVGVVVSEDVKSKRHYLSLAGMAFKKKPMSLLPELMRQNLLQKTLGIQPDPATYQIQKIIDVPHFVEKDQAPMLQIADACAFSFRRCLAKLEYGNDLVDAILSPELGPNFYNDDVWFSQTSNALFNTEAYWNDEQRRTHFASTFAQNIG